MPETSKCITISIGQPQITITINQIMIAKDLLSNIVNSLIKGEDIGRYYFGANITVSGGTPSTITMVVYLGKDANSLVEICRGIIPGYSGTGNMFVSGADLKGLYGYKTVDDILNKAGVANLTSCQYCIKIIW